MVPDIRRQTRSIYAEAIRRQEEKRKLKPDSLFDRLNQYKPWIIGGLLCGAAALGLNNCSNGVVDTVGDVQSIHQKMNHRSERSRYNRNVSYTHNDDNKNENTSTIAYNNDSE